MFLMELAISSLTYTALCYFSLLNLSTGASVAQELFGWLLVCSLSSAVHRARYHWGKHYASDAFIGVYMIDKKELQRL